MADMTLINVQRNESGDLDMVLDDGEFEMVEDVDACGVWIAERLLLGRSEIDTPVVDYVRNSTKGLDYYGILFKSVLSRGVKELEVKRVIFGTPGVRAITKWVWDQTEHSLSIEAWVVTIYGTVVINEVFA